jgi:hypothetical protein
MSNTQRRLTDRDPGQTLMSSYNDVNGTLSVDGFIIGLVGRKVTVAIQTTTIPNDSELFSFNEGASLLYQIKIIYTDGTRSQMISAERVA